MNAEKIAELERIQPAFEGSGITEDD